MKKAIKTEEILNEKKNGSKEKYSEKIITNKIAILTIVLMSAYALLSFNPLLSTGGDSATYILLADSFREGRPMQYSLDGSSLNPTYPPIYPFLLFLVSLVFGARNIIAFKALSFVAFVSQICIFYLLTEYFTKNNLKRLLGLMLFASLSVQIQLSSDILSESVFMAFLLASIYFYIKQIHDKSNNSLIISLIFALLASYTREAGVILFPIYFINELFAKNIKNLLLIASAFILSRVWSLVLILNGVESVYLKQIIYKDWYNISEGAHTPFSLVIRYLNSLFQHTMNIFNQLFRTSSRFMNIIVSLVILAFMSAKQNMRKFPEFEMIYFVLSVLSIPIFPYLDIRYTVVSLFSVILILIKDREFEKKRKLTIYIYAFMLIAMIINNIYIQMKYFIPDNLKVVKESNLMDFKSNTHLYPYEYQVYFDLAKQAENEFDESALFITRKPSLFTLFGNRDAIIFPFTNEEEVLDTFFSKHIGDYLVYDQKSKEMRILEDYIALKPEKFSMIFVSYEDEIVIFEILP
ncbi:MAG: hypothetical protein AB7T10_02195 [bacterium]